MIFINLNKDYFHSLNLGLFCPWTRDIKKKKAKCLRDRILLSLCAILLVWVEERLSKDMTILQ